MKITVYTVSDCQFSKQEKEYLKGHKLPYEEKNLETNKDFLTEMLAVGDNFAGTPLTRIEKDDGQSTVLKGFTPEEFDVALGYKPQEAKNVPAKVEETTSSNLSSFDSPSQTPLPPTQNEPPTVSAVIEPPQSNPSAPPAPPSSPDAPFTPPSQPNLPPSAPTPTTPPLTPTDSPSVPPLETPKTEQDQKMTSVLNNLQSMSGNSASLPDNTAPPNQDPSKIPSIPDPNFA